LLEFCRRELGVVRLQIEEALEHLERGETLAALGAWEGLETRLASASGTLQLIARLYPSKT